MFCPDCGQPVDPAPFDPHRQSRGLFAVIGGLLRRITGRSDPRGHCDHRTEREECE